MTSDDLTAAKADLIRDEGIRLRAYQDPRGVWTIGVGRNLRDEGITMAEAMTLLDNDLKACLSDLDVHLPWWSGLSPMRQRALLNLRFNLGMTGLLGFRKFLDAAKSGDVETAAQELEASEAATEAPGRYRRLALAWRQG